MQRKIGETNVQTRAWTKPPSPPGRLSFPPKTAYTFEENVEIQSPEQCLDLAEYDWAFKTSTLRESLAIRSPQNLSYFVLALYLWIVLEKHQCWANGKTTNEDTYPAPTIGDMPNTLKANLIEETKNQEEEKGLVGGGPANRKTSGKRKRPIASDDEDTNAGSDAELGQDSLNQPPIRIQPKRKARKQNEHPQNDPSDDPDDEPGRDPGYDPSDDPDCDPNFDLDDTPPSRRTRSKGKAPVRAHKRSASNFGTVRTLEDERFLNNAEVIAGR